MKDFDPYGYFRIPTTMSFESSAANHLNIQGFNPFLEIYMNNLPYIIDTKDWI